MMNISPTGHAVKDWGYEIVWASNQFYCGKILVFEKAGAETTVVIHKDRKKSWFINAGRFQIIFTDIKTGKSTAAILEEGKTVDIAEMSPHTVKSLQANSIIFESGTPDNLDDIFRLTPDDAQTSSEELK
jgi:mannose-6-phosphate isomerase-like protein (cupin superfamily)